MARSKKATTVQPVYLSISEVATMLSLGRTKIYDLIKHEDLPVIQFGDVKRIPVAKLRETGNRTKGDRQGLPELLA